jgi:protein SCO1/2
MSPSRIAGLVAIVLIAIVAGTLLYRHAARSGNQAPDFALVDQAGRPFVLSQQRGKPVILFFGYTHCTDVCPITLAHVAAAIRSLGTRGRDIEPLFVTVDPKRDDPAALGKYVSSFGTNFIGLTGTTAELDKTYAGYHVFAHAVPPGQDERGYEVEHGSALYYIDRDGALTSFGDATDDPDAIARRLSALTG